MTTVPPLYNGVWALIRRSVRKHCWQAYIQARGGMSRHFLMYGLLVHGWDGKFKHAHFANNLLQSGQEEDE